MDNKRAQTASNSEQNVPKATNKRRKYNRKPKEEKDEDGNLPQDTRDNNKLLTVFPNEIWELIIVNHLSGPENILRCNNASRFFRNTLESKKPEWLFPLIYPFIMNRIGYKDNLELRLVCKEWKHAVDTHSKNFSSERSRTHQGNDWSSFDDTANLRPRFPAIFHLAKRVNAFLDKLGEFRKSRGSDHNNYDAFDPSAGRSQPT